MIITKQGLAAEIYVRLVTSHTTLNAYELRYQAQKDAEFAYELAEIFVREGLKPAPTEKDQ